MSKKKDKKKTKAVKLPKLINVLEKALLKAGYEVERDGWTENGASDPPNDECEWLDVLMPDEEGNQISVHFYFTHKATQLDELAVYKADKKTGFDMPTILAKRKWEEKKK